MVGITYVHIDVMFAFNEYIDLFIYSVTSQSFQLILVEFGLHLRLSGLMKAMLICFIPSV